MEFVFSLHKSCPILYSAALKVLGGLGSFCSLNLESGVSKYTDIDFIEVYRAVCRVFSCLRVPCIFAGMIQFR